MKAFKVNKNGDLIIENGDLVMIDGRDELVQSIDRILTTNKGEWFLSMGYGLDYQAIQGKGKNKESIKLANKEAIFQDERVKEVDIVDVVIDTNRHLKVYGTVIDNEGNVIEL